MKLTLKEILFLIVIVFLCLLLIKSCNKQNSQTLLINSSKDTLITYRNELGQEVARRKLMLGSYEALKLMTNDQDSTIRKLIKLVNKKTISATIVDTKTSSEGQTKTEVVYDTIKNSKDSISPVYKTSWVDKWSTGIITAKKDSIYRNFVVFNEISIVQKFERQKGLKGFFKPDTSYVEVTNENPHTLTKGLASFSVSPPRQKIGLWASLGAIAGALIVIIAR